MDNHREKRSDTFRWNTRYELYNYFYKNYQLVKKEVDTEIRATMALFKPRRGRIIRTKELWQKVGLNLEDKYCISIELNDSDKKS